MTNPRGKHAWCLIWVMGVWGIVGCVPLATAPKSKECHGRLQFEAGQTWRYRGVSQRDIAILWDLKKNDPNETSQVQESLVMELAYVVQAVEPNGSAQLHVTFESVQVKRTRTTGGLDTRPDAVQALAGKSFRMRVASNGAVVTHHDLPTLLKEAAATAFREHPKGGRIKSPEMIWDVVALLWNPWGALEGQNESLWTTLCPLPTPWVSRQARAVTYRCAGIEETPTGCIATLTNTQALATEPAPRAWPIPYAGQFRQSGTFGFLMGYQIESLSGMGRHYIDLERGLSLGWEHFYTLKSLARMPLNFTSGSRVTVEQKLSMELLEGN